MKTYLCLDLGEKHIGLASGSAEVRLAQPLEVIEHTSRKADIEKILKALHRIQASHVVIGISYQEDGIPNSMGRHALSFGTALQEACGLPVEYCDEALSTRDARLITLESRKSKKDRRGHQDALAAAVILQSFFDNMTIHD
ncbi:Holliday junction resolvase RuvX [Leptolinea tardivitalis]|uniref:Putative pre-16S rRNA nuclease n=1 Tax=Leptolinea tardivitalis TaxID=229920 RepID=A0A0P6XYW1_9CHLR|nr:Holliday junction resolvase RuvX [Leptolinea tardivitalis]KPL74288.1 hypothetical protein ADM99_01575 [Leptolinea tardivitalis]GAP20529.1 RNAse H-fold protein YqgF [Leptolinea tardivitalis]